MKKNGSNIFILGLLFIGILLISILVFKITKSHKGSGIIQSRYDTTRFFQQKYLIKRDTLIYDLVDQVAKVHPLTNPDGNKTIISFKLPENTVAWSYYIGVDQASQQIFAHAAEEIIKASAPSGYHFNNYDPLAALALNYASFLVAAGSGENVKYWIVDGYNAEQFKSGQQFNFFKTGDIVNDFSRMTSPISGEYFLCLYNDNYLQGIDVMLKIKAVCVNEQWGTRLIRIRK